MLCLALNPGQQYGRHRRIHWAMADALFTALVMSPMAAKLRCMEAKMSSLILLDVYALALEICCKFSALTTWPSRLPLDYMLYILYLERNSNP